MESNKKKKKAIIIIISVLAAVIIISGAGLGVKVYLQNKKLQEEKQKIALEEERYSAQNFNDKSSNYVKVPENTEFSPGQIISFEIFYKNTGLFEVKDFEINTNIPENCKIVEDSLKNYSYKIESGNLAVKIGNLGIGSSGSLILAYRVNFGLGNDTIIPVPNIKFNYVKESALLGKKDNFVYEINQNGKFTVKSSPDFSRSVILIDGAKEDPNRISYGDKIIYKLYFYNNGDEEAKDVEVTVKNLDNLIISKEENKDFNIGSNSAALKLEALGIGEVKSFYLYTQVDSKAQNNMIIQPVMEIKYNGKIIEAKAPQSIVKLYPSFEKSALKITAVGGSAYSGDIVNANISITNTGNIEANNVIIKIVLSNLLSLNQGELSWNIPKLAVGKTASFNTSLKISDNITKDTTATARLQISSDEITGPVIITSGIAVSGEKPFTSGYIPIVAIHGVDQNPAGAYEMSTAEFDYLCGTLKAAGYKTITFMDLLNYLDRGKKLPEKPVIISSDDGYQNVYTYAFPILQKYGYKMTVFLVTGLIGNSDADRRINEFDRGKAGIPTRAMLIWPEIGAMSRYGIEFMSHTVSHQHLGDLSTEEALFEMTQSRIDIESHLKRPVPFLAWPYGNYSIVDVNLLGQAGYRGAVRYSGGIEDVRTLNIYGIKRVPIFSYTSTADYAALLGLK
ncbi:MAG: polysaccharide deacetylase family protein [Actinobacteria bacterium]|nr:polysaccharide deacetylase family protein [Actinomycetota bacterium]